MNAVVLKRLPTGRISGRIIMAFVSALLVVALDIVDKDAHRLTISLSGNIVLVTFIIVATLTGLSVIIWSVYKRKVTLIEQTRQKTQDDFVRNLRHQMQNHLQAISFAANHMPAVGDPNELKQVQYRVKKMGELVHELERLSNIRSGRLNTEIIDLGVLAKGIVEDFQSVRPQDSERIALYVDSVPHSPSICGDEGLIEQMIENLVSNALKYSSPPSRVEVSIREEESFVAVRVADRGIGIPQAEQDRVFEPLYRGSNVDKASKGTGLGLALAQRVALAHGGSCSIRSEIGRYTVIIARLPSARAEVAPGRSLRSWWYRIRGSRLSGPS